MGDESISGYVQNLSPVRVGPKKKFFDFHLQVEGKKSVRAICFSPAKRKLFDECEKNSTPVKIRKFMHDRKEGSTDILMSEYVIVEELKPEDVPFSKEELLPSDLNVSMLASISPQQLISLKAKLIHVGEVETVKTPHSTLRKCDGLLVDPSGSVKITLWEDDVGKVTEGETYEFKNLKLKKNNFSGQLYVNPAKGISSITPSEGFTEALSVPEYDPSELMICSIKGEIVGLADVHVDYSCIKCSNRVQPTKLAKCQNSRCNLVQRLDKCNKQWYVKAMVNEKDINVYVVFRHENVMKVMALSDETESMSGGMSEESVSEAFLSLPVCSITYHNKTKIVKTVELDV
jgi:hypothetical protein